MICGVISRKPVADITSADETSIEVQAVFNRALRAEGLDDVIEERNPLSTQWDPDSDAVPVLLVMSDNGPQMTSGATREFMALCWLATHYGRPGTPTDQAWTRSLFGHLKTEQPHLELIDDIDVLRAELEIQRERYNTIRLHAGIGYVTPDQEHRGQGHTIRAARRDGLARARQQRIAYHRNQPIPGTRTCGLNPPAEATSSQTHVRRPSWNCISMTPPLYGPPTLTSTPTCANGSRTKPRNRDDWPR